MLTKQMWLVAHLSDEKAVERVEAVVGFGNYVYIADHPRRCLTLGIDIYETFGDARNASVSYLDHKIQQLSVLREAACNQDEPYALRRTG